MTAESAETAGPADAPAASVSTHILDTSRGRPARGVAVTLSVRTGPGAPWTVHGTSATDADGRCKNLPAPPKGTTHVRLDFAVEPYFTRDRAGTAGTATGTSATDTAGSAGTHTPAEAQQDAPRTDCGPRDSGVFFPEVAIVFAVTAGEHYHVPLLLNPFGYSVYRGS